MAAVQARQGQTGAQGPRKLNNENPGSAKPLASKNGSTDKKRRALVDVTNTRENRKALGPVKSVKELKKGEAKAPPAPAKTVAAAKKAKPLAKVHQAEMEYAYYDDFKPTYLDPYAESMDFIAALRSTSSGELPLPSEDEIPSEYEIHDDGSFLLQGEDAEKYTMVDLDYHAEHPSFPTMPLVFDD